MFHKERLIEDCVAALAESDPREAVREIVARAVSEPDAVMRTLGEPSLGGVETIHRADDLTILKVVWAPGMEIFPHNHEMWAVIGVYAGREDNTFYRRAAPGLARHGTKVLETRDAVALGESVIHSVANPLGQSTGAIHVYGGDFFDTPRSEWDPSTFEEKPYDVEHTRRVFEEANERLRRESAGHRESSSAT